jgi:hypothetical protein
MNRDQVIRRHEYWWHKLQDAVPALRDRRTPEAAFFVEATLTAGSCNKHDGMCEYNLAYAMTTHDDEYDVTICHELCHAAVLMLNPWAARKRSADGTRGHGELWCFLFNTLMGQDRGQGHDYDVKAAKAKAEELRHG